MATKQGRKTTRAKRAVTLGKRETPPAQGNENFNQARRKKYASDPEFADKARQQAREYYRSGHPKQKSKLGRGKLLIDGVQKEVWLEGASQTLEVYSVPRAAEALGKTVVTFKRWIKDEMVPPPIIEDTVRGHMHYTKGELKVISRIMAQHEKDFSYFHTTHLDTIENLWQALEGYRRN